MKAGKWNYETNQYDPYDLPDGASCYEEDMGTVVACAQCGRKVTYGTCYTSFEVQTPHGFGYAVCPECYEKEWERRYGKLWS